MYICADDIGQAENNLIIKSACLWQEDGNLYIHYLFIHTFQVAYPDVDWQHVGQSFVSSLGLAWNPIVTQVSIILYLLLLSYIQPACVNEMEFFD